MSVAISSFGGIVPRLSAHSLGHVSATRAHNVKLRNGRIEPWRERSVVARVPRTSHSLALSGCCPMAWDQHVTVAELSPDHGRIYVAGWKDCLQMGFAKCDCEFEWFRAGLPNPVNPPVAAGPEKCRRDAQSRSYVYTYVSLWQEESAPSPPSNAVMVPDGDTVNVSGITWPTGYNHVVAASIYRTATGFRDPNDKVQKPATDYLYVATVLRPGTTYADSVPDYALGDVLDTEDVLPPPDGLRNITAIEGQIRLAGSVANRLYLTEMHQPYNWPMKSMYVLDSNIVHMGNLDDKLYVATRTTPYIVSVGDCEDGRCASVQDLGYRLPAVASGRRGFVMTRHGAIYASSVGVVLIQPNGRFDILTSRWFGEDEWVKLRPETTRLAYWEGYLFIVTDRASFVLDIDGDPFGAMRQAELTTIDDHPQDMLVSNTGVLHMLEDGVVYTWNTGGSMRPYWWESRDLCLDSTTGQNSSRSVNAHGSSGALPDMTPALGSLWSPASAKLRTEGTRFTLVSPTHDPAYVREVTTEEPFRLPRVGRHLWYRVRLEGTGAVEFCDLGTANLTVNRGV